MGDRDIKDYMNCCRVPPMRSHLCERILLASRYVDVANQQDFEGFGFRSLLNWIGEGLMIPKPAYAFASVLLVSVLAGTQADISTIMNQQSSIIDPPSYMDVYSSFGTEYQMVGVVEKGDVL